MLKKHRGKEIVKFAKFKIFKEMTWNFQHKTHTKSPENHLPKRRSSC